MTSYPLTDEENQALSDFWKDLAFATAHPQAADVATLCQTLDALLIPLSSQDQLTWGAEAITRLSEIIHARSAFLIGDWEQRHNPSEPQIQLEQSVDLFVQSQHLDFSDLFEPSDSVQYPTGRQSRLPLSGSVAGELDKQSLLAALDRQMETHPGMSDVEAFNTALSVAHTEDISAWTTAIATYLEQGHATASLTQLCEHLHLPRMALWLSLLLGGFALEPIDAVEFYGQDIQVIGVQN
jgi:hypothetical protein